MDTHNILRIYHEYMALHKSIAYLMSLEAKATLKLCICGLQNTKISKVVHVYKVAEFGTLMGPFKTQPRGYQIN